MYRGYDWSDVSFEKLIVSAREENPIVDLQIDGRPVFSCWRISPEPMTQRVDEKGMVWFTRTWTPSVAGSMVMRSHVRIRSRDLISGEGAVAYAALIGSHLRSCQCEGSVARIEGTARDRDPIDGLTLVECRTRWQQNRRDIDAGIPLTFALTPAQVAAAKSSLGL